MASVRDSDKTKPYIPLASLANDGYNKDGEATATCYCGAVQLAFPINRPGFVDSFLCNCTDCRKITASTFASNFVVRESYVKHLRGKENLSVFSQSHTIGTPNTMANHFCKTCGSLMYRIGTGFPGMLIMRLGTVDDFNLVEKELKPRLEQFVKDRVSWLPGASEIKQVEGYAYGPTKAAL